MNTFFRTATALTLIVSSATFAADVTSSQYQHQTNSGSFEVTPSVTFGAIKYHYNNNNPDFTNSLNSMFGFNILGEYGVSDVISVGLRLGYEKDNYQPGGTATTIPNTKGDGMTDPDIYVNARSTIGGGSLRYGANLSFSLGTETVGTTSSESYSGGLTLTPFVGYEYGLGGGIAGARVTYDLVQTDRSWNIQGQSGKIKGGNELTATLFYEMTFHPVLVGVDVGVINYASSQFAGISMDNAYTTEKIDVYEAYYIAKNITILPTVGYNTLDTGSQLGRLGFLGAKNSGGVYATIGARFSF